MLRLGITLDSYFFLVMKIVEKIIKATELLFYVLHYNVNEFLQINCINNFEQNEHMSLEKLNVTNKNDKVWIVDFLFHSVA